MEVASDLARRLGVSLHVVTADEPPTPVVAAPGAVPPVSTLAEPVTVKRGRLLQDLAEAGVAAQLHVTYGPADRALERVAQAERARLLVVGSRGHGVFRRLFTGSVSGRLAVAGERPVLIVSQPHGPADEASAA